MRRLMLLVAMLTSATAAQAQQQPAPPAPAAYSEAVSQVDALQQRLLASQQTIATLQRELADARTRSEKLDQCRVRNGRLLSIGRQLIDGYDRRYRKERHHDPLQLGRRRYEFELQALGDTIYDNAADVVIALPGTPQAAALADAPTPEAPKPETSNPGAAKPGPENSGTKK